MDTYLEYAVGSVKGMNEPDQPGIPIKISHLSPPPISCGSSLEEALGTEKELALLTYPVGRGFSKTWLISVIIPPLSLVKPKKNAISLLYFRPDPRIDILRDFRQEPTQKLVRPVCVNISRGLQILN